MVNKGRREQVFDACNYLHTKGFKEMHQYTYRAMHDACESLGYPRGHQGTMVKYRDEWLNSHLSETDEKTSQSSSPENQLLQSALDTLLCEHKEKIKAELNAQYETQLATLESEKENLLLNIDLIKEESNDTKQKLNQAQETLDSQQTYFHTVHADNVKISNERTKLFGECEVLKIQVSSKEAQLKSKLKTINEHHESLLESKLDYIVKLELQIESQDSKHQKTLNELKSASDSRYLDVAKRNENLERQIKETEGDYQSVKTDFARQEMTINLFERERAEFYKEFTVMRKKFEQIPKWQELVIGQKTLTEKIDELSKQCFKESEE